jgi:hypothetical protein
LIWKIWGRPGVTLKTVPALVVDFAAAVATAVGLRFMFISFISRPSFHFPNCRLCKLKALTRALGGV